MKDVTIDTAVILAGGLGTRLRSVVPDRPKVLAEVGGRPFVEYLLDQLASEGVRSIVLCTGYLANQVQGRLGLDYRGMTLCYSREQQPLGTGGALRLALPLFKSEPVLVLNGDSYCDGGLAGFARWHVDRKGPATILLVEAEDTRRFGRVRIDGEGHVLEFSEKTHALRPGLINAGIYLLSRELIASIAAGRAVSLERDVFPGWIGCGLRGFTSKGTVWDIGVPEAYARANFEIMASISR